ncbi:hypothetical protein [Arsenophonus nasoniae]|uniref:hypothetical protein n=1 Tax=Arsenophonus nasoniae TaxID=638 RepID=UPI0038797404
MPLYIDADNRILFSVFFVGAVMRLGSHTRVGLILLFLTSYAYAETWETLDKSTFDIDVISKSKDVKSEDGTLKRVEYIDLTMQQQACSEAKQSAHNLFDNMKSIYAEVYPDSQFKLEVSECSYDGSPTEKFVDSYGDSFWLKASVIGEIKRTVSGTENNNKDLQTPEEVCMNKSSLSGSFYTKKVGSNYYANVDGCEYIANDDVLICSEKSGTCYAKWNPTGKTVEDGNGKDNEKEKSDNKISGQSPNVNKVLESSSDFPPVQHVYNPVSGQSDFISPSERECADIVYPTYQNVTSYDDSGNPVVRKEPAKFYNTFNFMGNNYLQKYGCLYVRTSEGYKPSTSRAVYEAFDTGKLNDCTWKSGFTEVHNCSYRGERPKTQTDSAKSSGSTGINDAIPSNEGNANSKSGASSLGSAVNIFPSSGTRQAGVSSSSGVASHSGQSSGSTGNGQGTDLSHPDNNEPDLDSPTAESILSPLQHLFPFLENFNLPERTASCPVATFEVFEQRFVIDAHCTLFESIRGLLTLFSMIIWSFLGLRIVLSS